MLRPPRPAGRLGVPGAYHHSWPTSRPSPPAQPSTKEPKSWENRPFDPYRETPSTSDCVTKQARRRSLTQAAAPPPAPKIKINYRSATRAQGSRRPSPRPPNPPLPDPVTGELTVDPEDRACRPRRPTPIGFVLRLKRITTNQYGNQRSASVNATWTRAPPILRGFAATRRQ